MEVRFLGSGDAFGTGGRFQTCLHVRDAAGEFLLDCGTSSLIAMKRGGVDPSAIGLVLLTHLHGDHFGGLPFLVLDGQFSRRTLPLVVAGPPGTAARLEATMEALFPGSSRVTRRFPLEVVEPGERVPRALGPATVTAFPVVHASGAPAYALRVEVGGRTIAYSGDTEWTESLVEAARDSDLFVCEAYSFERKFPFHLDWATLAAHRERLGCRRLVLTHMGREMLAKAGDVDAECAEDGYVVTL